MTSLILLAKNSLFSVPVWYVIRWASGVAGVKYVEFPCRQKFKTQTNEKINPSNAELNPICHLVALLEGATVVDVSGLRVKMIKRSYKTSHFCKI